MKSATERPAAPFDAIADDLQLLRSQAGGVSYAEIAARIARRREEQGMSAASARVARSTVFDAFRSGRRRINAELVAEIAVALGESDESADRWRRRCLDAHTAAVHSEVHSGAHSEERSAARTAATIPQLSVPLPEHPHFRSLRTALIAALLACFVGLNIFGNTVADKFGLPLFLDMIGTAAAAFALGPLSGVAVGVATNVLVTVSGSPVSLAFTPVNVIGALIWGCGFHRYRLRTPLKFFLLNIYAGLACTLVALPITVLVFDGTVTHASNTTAAFFTALGHGIWMAVFSANLVSSLCDKLFAGYLAAGITRILAPLRLRDQAQDQARSGSAID